ncbi:MAG: hypothetical protein ACOYMA_11155 [Bacteroidia bacterium]
METIKELILKSNIPNSRVLQIVYLKDSQKIVLLKCNERLELYIDILDIKNNLHSEIIFQEKMHVISASINNSRFDSNDYYLYEFDTTLHITHFHVIDEEHFFLKALKNGKNYLNLKINIKGEIFHLPTFENSNYGDSLNEKHIIKNFIYREDMTLFDINDCRERNLYDFISENFDDLDKYPAFTYLYFTEDRYTIFTSPDKNIIGFEIYDKDGDEPKFSYYILEIESLENIKIIFKGKIYDSGHYYTLSEDTNEFAYKRQNYDDETKIYIRELSENFHQAEIHKEIIDEKIIYLDKKKIVLQKQNEIQVLDRRTDYQQTIIIDESSPYEIKDNFLFYIKDSKLTFSVI